MMLVGNVVLVTIAITVIAMMFRYNEAFVAVTSTARVRYLDPFWQALIAGKWQEALELARQHEARVCLAAVQSATLATWIERREYVAPDRLVHALSETTVDAIDGVARRCRRTALISWSLMLVSILLAFLPHPSRFKLLVGAINAFLAFLLAQVGHSFRGNVEEELRQEAGRVITYLDDINAVERAAVDESYVPKENERVVFAPKCPLCGNLLEPRDHSGYARCVCGGRIALREVGGLRRLRAVAVDFPARYRGPLDRVFGPVDPRQLASTPTDKMTDDEMLFTLKRLCAAYVGNDIELIRLLEPRATAIGTELSRRGGIVEMRRMWERLGDVRGARTLEMHWDGIGEWRG